jgi:SAM-dependent methyltransferase
VASNEEVKEQQRRQWAGRADGWDDFNEVLGRPLTPVSDWICREARIGPGMTVLDLAGGTGEPSLAEARLVGPQGRVVATDLAQEMIDNLARRARDADISNIDTRVVDAENIPFPDRSFDAVTMQHGLMFCAEPSQVVSEVYRTLRPGGRFALSVWGDPARSSVNKIIEMTFSGLGKTLPPPLMGIPGGLGLAAPGSLEEVLRRGGFPNPVIKSMFATFRFSTLDDVWQFEVERNPDAGKLLVDASAADIGRLKQQLASILDRYREDGHIKLDRFALCAVCEK